jgi:sulfonate transport system permease protein
MTRRIPARRFSTLYTLLGASGLSAIIGLLLAAIIDKYEGTPFLAKSGDFATFFISPTLWQGMMHTLVNFIVGFSIALLLGTILGMAMGRVPSIEAVFHIPVHFLRPIPSAAVIPLALLVFTYTGNSMKTFVIAFGALWPILMNVFQASKNVDPLLIDTGRTLGKSRAAVFWYITFRMSLEGVMTGARIGFAIALLLAVTTEMIVTGDPRGIGYVILDSERSFHYPEMLAGIVTLGLMGWMLDAIFERIDRRVLFWHHGHRARI